MQRTLAVELQRLSLAFRKQQKGYLNSLRKREGGATGSGSSRWGEIRCVGFWMGLWEKGGDLGYFYCVMMAER